MNGDLLYVWNAPTYIIKFIISIKNSRKGTAFLRITQYNRELYGEQRKINALINGNYMEKWRILEK